MRSFLLSITAYTWGFEKGQHRIERANNLQQAIKQAEKYAISNYPEAQFLKVREVKLY